MNVDSIANISEVHDASIIRFKVSWVSVFLPRAPSQVSCQVLLSFCVTYCLTFCFYLDLCLPLGGFPFSFMFQTFFRILCLFIHKVWPYHFFLLHSNLSYKVFIGSFIFGVIFDWYGPHEIRPAACNVGLIWLKFSEYFWRWHRQKDIISALCIHYTHWRFLLSGI
jgi:hypothetical protein